VETVENRVQNGTEVLEKWPGWATFCLPSVSRDQKHALTSAILLPFTVVRFNRLEAVDSAQGRL